MWKTGLSVKTVTLQYLLVGTKLKNVYCTQWWKKGSIDEKQQSEISTEIIFFYEIDHVIFQLT